MCFFLAYGYNTCLIKLIQPQHYTLYFNAEYFNMANYILTALCERLPAKQCDSVVKPQHTSPTFGQGVAAEASAPLPPVVE